MANADLLLRVFLQLAVILAACRLVGMVARRIGQAQVVGEMVAGVLLGPSFFGLLFPTVQQWLFPLKATVGGQTITHPSMAILYVIAHVGLALYMFLVGLEFDANLLRGRTKHAGFISAGGILVPFLLGGLIALLIYQQGNLFGQGISLGMAALFLGASMCITAFPVLARIVEEHHLGRTRLGTLVLTAASINDITAWCLLAVVLAAVKSSAPIALVAIGGGLLYVALMFTLGRRGLRVLEHVAERRGMITEEILSVSLLIVLICSWITSQIGIYEVFGAFILGVVMPRGPFASEVRRRLEGVTTGLLLPIFFVFSGLNTQIGLLKTPAVWFIAIVIILAATAGKGFACVLGARFAGMSWRESAAVGALMNARGLIELIIINIGLEEGIITPTLFTILVFMALCTTLMASPMLRLFYGSVLKRRALAAEGGTETTPAVATG